MWCDWNCPLTGLLCTTTENQIFSSTGKDSSDTAKCVCLSEVVVKLTEIRWPSPAHIVQSNGRHCVYSRHDSSYSCLVHNNHWDRRWQRLKYISLRRVDRVSFTRRLHITGPHLNLSDLRATRNTKEWTRKPARMNHAPSHTHRIQRRFLTVIKWDGVNCPKISYVQVWLV